MLCRGYHRADFAAVDNVTMSLDGVINILVTITLIEMMVLIGLQATFTELVQTARNLRLVAWAAAANYLFVPGVAIGLLICSMPVRWWPSVFSCSRLALERHLARRLRALQKQTCPWQLA